MKKNTAIIALCLLLPAPSIGTLLGMIILAEGAVGKICFFISKLWILIIPLVWRIWVDKKPISISRSKHGGFLTAAMLGLGISGVIYSVYFTLGKILIDPNDIKAMASNTGLDDFKVYFIGACYWITVNSVLEEYVWRWFVVEKFNTFLPSYAAICGSALGFTIHHIIAMQIYFSPLVVIIASTGIFIGGAAWSWCYIRYKSIWPGYISHAIVDLAIFHIGYLLIFK